MTNQIIDDRASTILISQLPSVLAPIHENDPGAFRARALTAIEAGAVQVIRAAANNLRVFTGASEEDVAVIQAYGGHPDPAAKRGAIFAITYMGKFTDLLPSLKLQFFPFILGGDKKVATDLADAVTLRANDTDAAFATSLFLHSTVISKNVPGKVTIDAGLKSFATDGPLPGV